jgi:outer membrane immunogenic protein
LFAFPKRLCRGNGLRIQFQRLAFGLLAAGSPFAIDSVMAQDLIAGPALEPSTENSWTGIHLGVGLGAHLSDTAWTTDCLAPIALPTTCPNDAFGGGTRIGNDNPVSFDDSGARLSGYLGVDWQLERFVIGIEGEAAWADNSRTHIGIPGTWSIGFGPDQNTARIESAWDASVRARTGLLLTPKTLVYATGGLALMHQEVSAACEGTFPLGWCGAPNADSISAITTGWTVGGGIERMLGRAWIVRGEYRYSDYGSRSFTLFEDAPLDSVAVTIEQKTSLAYVGVSRKF